MNMDAPTRALMERLVTALRPMTKRFWTETERNADDGMLLHVRTSYGAVRETSALHAEAVAALEASPADAAASA